MDSKKIEIPDCILIGASLSTGNMGVSALLVSTAKCILRARPGARISLLEGAAGAVNDDIPLGDGRTLRLGRVGVRRNKTVWRANHLLRLLLAAAAIRLLPSARLRKRLLAGDPYLGAISGAGVVADITGGDSFSDIYGLQRLVFGTMIKALVILTGQRLVLLPQTYGPFKGRIAKALARWVLARSHAVYSRDQEGLEAISSLMGERRMKAKPSFAYDMAFMLEPMAPAETPVHPGPLPPKEGHCLVGLNVSGLLYHSKADNKGQFGFSVDYRALVRKIAEALLERPDMRILLVPHVYGHSSGFEDDPKACEDLYSSLADSAPGRIFLLKGRLTESELKYVIGGCDFFIGSRMHACIAAISQGIPAAPLAYSAKFAGVFRSIGVGDLVVDLGAAEPGASCRTILGLLDRRIELSARLRSVLPGVRETVLALARSVFGKENGAAS